MICPECNYPHASETLACISCGHKPNDPGEKLNEKIPGLSPLALAHEHPGNSILAAKQEKDK